MLGRVLIISTLISIFITVGGLNAVEHVEEAFRVDIVEEYPNRLLLDLEFDKPNLKVVQSNSGTNRLWVDIPGSVLDIQEQGPALPSYSKLIAVPDGYRVEVRIVDRLETKYNPEEIINRDASARSVRLAGEKPAIEVGEAGWMRWLKVAPVTIRPTSYNFDQHTVKSTDWMQVEFSFVEDEDSYTGLTPNEERYWSAAFDELFDGMLLNRSQARHVAKSGKIRKRGSYVIITDQYLSDEGVSIVHEFIDWKSRKGFNVVLSDMYERGQTTAEDIKEYLQDAYDNWDRPPECVLLLGDVNAPGIQLPSFRIVNPLDPSENDVTDHPYSLLRGDDYFSDIMVGRISCDSPNPSGAQKALIRSMSQERDPMAQVDDSDIFRRATIFAGNYGEGNRPIISPVETAMWLEERLTEYGYDVESFYYRRVGDNQHPGPIIESIDRGTNIVAYRGWADANGPHFPEFHKEDLDELDNGPHLPIFTYFVCNVGDFGNVHHEACFGEYSLTRGTRNNPAGAVWFYGPSDLHTKTQYNNPALAGFYQALLYERIRNLGAVVYRSKMEVYKGFPNQVDDDGVIDFYSHVYNILGDPEFHFNLDEPHELAVDHPDVISVGSTYFPIGVSRRSNGAPLKNALATVRWGENKENQITMATDADGEALIPVEVTQAGEMDITVLSWQAIPYLADVSVEELGAFVGLESYTVTDDNDENKLSAGSEIEIAVTLKNFSNVGMNGVNAVLSTPFETITILDSAASFGNIGFGSTAEGDAPFHVLMPAVMQPGFEVPFLLEITDSSNRTFTALMRIPVWSGHAIYADHSIQGGSINPGQTKNLILSLQNVGSMDLTGVTAEIHTHDEAVLVGDASAEFGDISMSNTADCSENPFGITVRNGTAIGRRVMMRAVLSDADDNHINTVYFEITVGTPDTDDPLGPDAYGYYAYEDVDDGDKYPDAPEYNWIELDPDFGGEGANLHNLTDDESVSMELPFTFKFYGEEYDSVTICSNGWFTFVDTWMANFRNWSLPSPLGPHTMVAPFWEDLVGDSIGFDGQKVIRDSLRIFTRYDQGEGRFVIEWSRLKARSANTEYVETFEAILYDPSDNDHATITGDGEIVFQYKDLTVTDRGETNYATVGIQDWNHRKGLQVTFANNYPEAIEELASGRAIKITTDPPDRYLEVNPDLSLTPENFDLSDPYPNPFNSRTIIEYSLPQRSNVRLSLWDTNGRYISNLRTAELSAGVHSTAINVADLPSGVYLIRLDTERFVSQKKVLLLR